MSERQHTPGPWTAEQDDKDRWRVKSLHWSDEEPGIAGDHSKAWPLLEDDAKLIAAAPEILAALYEANNALLDYVPSLEARGASLNYGRTVLAQIAAALALVESR